jgi:hypothetical protein
MQGVANQGKSEFIPQLPQKQIISLKSNIGKKKSNNFNFNEMTFSRQE